MCFTISALYFCVIKYEKMSNYKALIFDLGRVVFPIDFKYTYEYWQEVTGIGKDKIKSIVEKLDIHNQFETGEATQKDFADDINKALDCKMSEAEFERGWNAIFLPAYEGLNELLIELKKSYRMISLSNTNSTHTKVWRERYKDTLQHFEVIFASQEIGARKPNAPSYQVCLDYLKVPGKAVVFLDDKMENLDGAAKLGIHGIEVRSFEQMVDDLKRMGIG